jgi:ubiquinone/menaquinone biosynthesis C-methylase UbiE
MPIFHRGKSEASPSNAPAASPPAHAEEQDWRSFDSVADTYARLMAPNFSKIATDLVGLLGVSPGQRVLDVGTGTGVAARAAKAALGDSGVAVGIDPSLGMLRMAAAAGGPSYAASTSIDLPFADATFDHLLGNFVLAFFPDYRTALFELLRVLRPGGRVAVTAWGPGEDQDELRTTWRRVAEEFAEHEILEDAAQRAIPWERKFGDRNELKDVLHDAGLRDIWTELRDYRFDLSREDWLTSREVTPVARFLKQMLGDEYWEIFRTRVRTVFAENFPDRINDFRDAVLAVGHKPAAG